MHVLVIEDEAAVVDRLRRRLQAEGHEVTCASDAIAAR